MFVDIAGILNVQHDAQLWDLKNLAAKPVILSRYVQGGAIISPNNRWLVTSDSYGDIVQLWDLQGKEPAANPVELSGQDNNRITYTAFNSNSRWLVTRFGDQTVRLWDLGAKGPTATPIVLLGYEERGIERVGLSSDNKLMFAVGESNTIEVWDLTAEKLAAPSIVSRLSGSDFKTITISPDQRWLATGSSDGTVRLWNLRFKELMELACRTVGRNLTFKEWRQYFPGQKYRKTCFQLPIHYSFIEHGKSLARDGYVDSAFAILKRADELETSRDLAEARKWIAQGLIEKGRQFARHGKAEYAMVIFQKALKLYPQISLHPQRETARGLIYQGGVLARQGKTKEAIVAYEKAKKLDPTLKFSDRSLGLLCLYGSLWGHAAEVMFAFDKAVALDSADGLSRRDRGIARAQVNDTVGAIEDFHQFQAYLKLMKDEQEWRRVQNWIETLQSGENPFRPEKSEWLRKEFKEYLRQ